MFKTMFMLANRHIGKFIAQELANTTWAFGTATRSDAVLFAALARAMERCLGAFSAQNLANTAWAFETATQSDAVLFAALARAVQRRLGAFIAQALANTAWAFGTATQSDAVRRWRGRWSDAWVHSSRRLSPTQRGRSGRQPSRMRKDPQDQTTNGDHDKKKTRERNNKRANHEQPINQQRRKEGNRTQTRQQTRKRNKRSTQYIISLSGVQTPDSPAHAGNYFIKIIKIL